MEGKHPMCMYYWSWWGNWTPKYGVCITGVGRKTPNVYVLLELCMYYPWSEYKGRWEGIRLCLKDIKCISSNVYVLLELVGKTSKYVCITGVGRKTPNVYGGGGGLPMCINVCIACITGVGGKNITWTQKKPPDVYVLLELVGCKTSNVYVLLELEGKHPMCMYYWSGKNTQICMYYWSWKENTQCVLYYWSWWENTLELEGKHPICTGV